MQTCDRHDATGAKILVVDDEEDVREIFRLALTRKGYEVAHFGDGAEAVKAATEQQFGLAFVDIAMPGMDGVTVVENLRRVSPTTNIVMITAFLDGGMGPEERQDRVQKALSFGARGCLRKPFGTETILKTAEYFAR
ncbi:MAG: response regulator [Armatimonadetes bacterium]|nr:response regulator [Armatimonadota bacterium]